MKKIKGILNKYDDYYHSRPKNLTYDEAFSCCFFEFDKFVKNVVYFTILHNSEVFLSLT